MKELIHEIAEVMRDLRELRISYDYRLIQEGSDLIFEITVSNNSLFIVSNVLKELKGDNTMIVLPDDRTQSTHFEIRFSL